LAEDRELREQVELAERLGISFKRLSGWEPTTYYEYDDAGRLVASRPEAEWDDVEIGWMLGLAKWRQENLCPLCGGPKEVCQADYGVYAYGTRKPVICHVTEALDMARKAWKDHPTPGALLHMPRVVPWGTPMDD
jgi:hypothetical protein